MTNPSVYGYALNMSIPSREAANFNRFMGRQATEARARQDYEFAQRLRRSSAELDRLAREDEAAFHRLYAKIVASRRAAGEALIG